ncbi:hypothetical protein [Sphingomonas sp.]|uniref:hypothetical protein n=1 Tax=Sphingomonas sp. TaxID=28214 RepID=UPI003B3BCF8D
MAQQDDYGHSRPARATVSVRAAALIAVAVTAAPATHPLLSYVEQGARNDGRIEVLMLEDGGRAIGLVARRQSAGGLDLAKGYWLSCGR